MFYVHLALAYGNFDLLPLSQIDNSHMIAFLASSAYLTAWHKPCRRGLYIFSSFPNISSSSDLWY
jgi:hypothetical protein